MTFLLRDVTVNDFDEIVMLNNASTPMVNDINRQVLEELSDMACYFQVAIDKQVPKHEKMVGVLLVLPSNQPYQSGNYQWFNDRYSHFGYVDRIFVKPDYLGQGIGRLLYRGLFAWQKQAKITSTCCEVNIKPMNQPSLLFHQQWGFIEVGQRDSAEDKRVVMLLKK